MNRKTFIFWSIFSSIAIMRVVFSFFQSIPSIGSCQNKAVIGVGNIVEEPQRTESGQILVVSSNGLSVNEEKCLDENTPPILVRMKTKLYPKYSFGDIITFSGKLNVPFNFSNSKNDPSARTFDYKGYLAKNDIYYEIKSAQISFAGDAVNDGIKWLNIDLVYNWLTKTLFKIKIGFVANLEKVLGEPHAALAAGLVVGEKSALGKDLLEDFRTVGLIHIVVLSGFNITIVADAIRRLLSRLPRVWGIVLGGIGICMFGILVGGGATVVRSCFMAGIALSADLIRRDYNVTRALIFAGLIMLIQNPMILLHDPSFQLSFLATLGLIMLSSPIEKKLTFITEKFGMRGIVASCFATQIFVSPYILYMMGQLSIIGIVVNILVLPFIPITMLFVFLTGAFGFIFPQISLIIGWVTHLLLSYELFMVTNFARLPFAAIHLPVFSFWWVVGFYGGFASIYIFLSEKEKVRMNQLQNHHNDKDLMKSFNKLNMINVDSTIQNSDKDMFVAEISIHIAVKIGLNKCYVVISERSLKHIIERRGNIARNVVEAIPIIIRNPEKISDNSLKRKYSYIFSAQCDTRNIGIIVVKTKTPGVCRVVSAFPIKIKTYRKLVDISGRTEFPPFELPS